MVDIEGCGQLQGEREPSPDRGAGKGGSALFRTPDREAKFEIHEEAINAAMLAIQLLGEFQVRRDGEPVTLPPSRKTRALVGYLALSGRPQRRERLCELFWEVPDDPRASLRWSLSKIRMLLDRPDAVVVRADRNLASLSLTANQVDLLAIRDALRDGVDAAGVQTLMEVAERFGGEFLAGLDMPRQPEFQSWLHGVREEVRQLHAAVLIALDDRLAASPEQALPYIRRLVELDPYSEDAWARLVQRLNDLGRRREAEEQYLAAATALADVGGVGHLLTRARGAASPPAGETTAAPKAAVRQEIRFCRSGDGVRLAFALAGEGPPLVKAANWLNHLEYDWEGPVWSHLLRRMADRHRLLRYDSRGNGLSDWDPANISLEHWVQDLEAVVDAAGYDRFPLLGVSQGCAISIEYAVRHPERVSHLVLYAGFGAGAFMRGDPEATERRRALITLMKLGWGQQNPAFRQTFTTLFVPGATLEQMDAFNELQRRTASPEIASRHYTASAQIDVRHLLDKVVAPTLVMHGRGDAVVPIELGRQMAAAIPGARFVPLPTQNHLFLEGEPAADRFFEELELFLAT